MDRIDGQHRWAIVLAAGEGTRLRVLTIGADGVAIPKQYCSFDGEASLCEWALTRAERAVPQDRVAVIVAADHRRWAERELSRRPRALAVVQPENRGTGPGILLPLLRILARDPAATVLVLPSDHFAADEPVFAHAAAQALAHAEAEPETLVLLGAAPEDGDPDLGWILPGRRERGGLRAVDAFVEKPERSVAADLARQGGLVNTFVFATRGATLLALCRREMPEITARLSACAPEQMTGAYADLPSADFSRTILERAGPVLRVLDMPPCGWSDLGTPQRVATCLHQLRARQRTPRLDANSLAARALAHETSRRFELAF